MKTPLLELGPSALKELVKENKLPQPVVVKMIDKLGQAYADASETPRFSTEVAGKQAVVIASDGLAKEVRQIIESTIH